jgi:alpha-ketoglutarate-dependent taurine dioxygenase
MLSIAPTGEACGAVVTGLSLSKELDVETVKAIRAAWLEHHVLVFPDQAIDPDSFERFVGYFGPIADDPYIAPIDGHERIAAIQRRADETGRIFADSWHSDWSFKPRPPAGTFLYGITIPPVGGDTLFCNEHKALEDMPADLKAKLEGKAGKHSAKAAYANDGKYAADKYEGSMEIRTSDEAKATFGHLLVRPHPETGEPGIFGGSYVYDVEGMANGQAGAVLEEMNGWLARPEFQYTHKWQPNMLVMWDNRSVLHKATGGFEGHDRLLHRLTIEDDPKYYL